MSREDLQQRLNANEDLLIIDIQVEDELSQHHIPGSIATCACPVKPEEPPEPLIIWLPMDYLKSACGFLRMGCRAGSMTSDRGDQMIPAATLRSSASTLKRSPSRDCGQNLF